MKTNEIPILQPWQNISGGEAVTEQLQVPQALTGEPELYTPETTLTTTNSVGHHEPCMGHLSQRQMAHINGCARVPWILQQVTTTKKSASIHKYRF